MKVALKLNQIIKWRKFWLTQHMFFVVFLWKIHVHMTMYKLYF